MKQCKMAFVFLFFFSLSFGQNLSPTVYSSSGGFFVQSNATLSWTLGEEATSTYVKTTVIVTQGFQQYFPLNTSVYDFAEEDGIKLFPNPFTDFFVIETVTQTEACTLEIYSNQGILVQSQKFVSDKFLVKADMLSSGIYLVKITDNKGQVLKTYKIVKL